MRILAVLPNDLSGGAEQYLKMLLSNMEDSTVEIYFLNKPLGDFWTEIPANINLHYQNTGNKFLAVILFFFKMISLKNSKFDYIFTSHVYTNGLVGLLIRIGIIRKKFFVARESTTIFHRFKGFKLRSYKLFYQLGYRPIDLLICQTELMKNQLVKGMPKIEGYTKIEVIPNPIDTNLIIKNANKAGPGDLPKKYVVAAGRLIQLKGFDNLIYVFAEIRIKHPDLSLIILGDGPENKTLKDIIKKTKLDDAVILPGQVKNVYPYFKNASVCVVSSITEGFPNVLLQMMSQNNKVVSTLCAGGIEDIPGIYTCQTQNNEALREKIELALNTDKDNRDVFKDYLDIRSIKHFIKSMNYHLETYS